MLARCVRVSRKILQSKSHALVTSSAIHNWYCIFKSDYHGADNSTLVTNIYYLRHIGVPTCLEINFYIEIVCTSLVVYVALIEALLLHHFQHLMGFMMIFKYFMTVGI